MSYDEKKVVGTTEKEMLCAILYLESLDKSRSSDLKKRVDNDYVLSKAEYPSTFLTLQILVLNYQPNYNSNGQPQSQGVINQLMFSQRGKTGDYECEKK